jgi:hypothetical protein
MILYLLRRYLVLLAVILGAVFSASYLFGIDYVFSSAPSVVFGSSVVALGWLYRRFEQRNLWVLYDNLRWPPLVLLGSLFVGTQGISLALFLWL